MANNSNSICSNNLSWQETLNKKRKQQTRFTKKWATRIAKKHLKRAKKFIIKERLAGHTVAASFSRVALCLYSGHDMKSFSQSNPKPKLELRYPSLIIKNTKYFCPEAHYAFKTVYRQNIANGLGVNIDDIFLTELNENPQKQESTFDW